MKCDKTDCKRYNEKASDGCRESGLYAIECMSKGFSHYRGPKAGEDGGTVTIPATPAPHDPVRHPAHYTSRVPGIECIQVTEHFDFNRGNAIKYIWRAGEKDPKREIEDLRKAAWYINREILNLEAKQ